MKKKHHIYNNVFVKYGELIKSDFDISPVWVEHNIPKELEQIRKRGVTDEWIEQYFYEEIPDSSHPFYSIVGDSNYYKSSEFIYIGCILNINDNIFHGYITVFDSYLTTLNLFHYGRTISFYLNDLFEEENTFFKFKIESITEKAIKEVQINLKSDFKGFKNSENNLVINSVQNVLLISF